MTFCATVQAILHVGATPCWPISERMAISTRRQFGNVSPSRTRAIMPVHMAGLPCDMNAIWDLARKHGLHVIEDAAHAAGACYDGRPIGAGPTATPEPAMRWRSVFMPPRT